MHYVCNYIDHFLGYGVVIYAQKLLGAKESCRVCHRLYGNGVERRTTTIPQHLNIHIPFVINTNLMYLVSSPIETNWLMGRHADSPPYPGSPTSGRLPRQRVGPPAWS